MPTFNLLFKIYGEKKHSLFKITNICLLFRRFVNVFQWSAFVIINGQKQAPKV